MNIIGFKPQSKLWTQNRLRRFYSAASCGVLNRGGRKAVVAKMPLQASIFAKLIKLFGFLTRT